MGQLLGAQKDFSLLYRASKVQNKYRSDLLTAALPLSPKFNKRQSLNTGTEQVA
jgi:hypothetical protein